MQPTLLPTLDPTAPSEVNPVTPVAADESTAAPSASAPTKARMMLNITQRAKLLTWIEDNRTLAETETDPDLVVTAGNELGFTIHASHIRTIRNHLGIAKAAKPEPTPELPPDLDLVSLHQRVTALEHTQTTHDARFDHHAIAAASMKATLAALHDRLKTLLALHNYNAAPGCSIPELPPIGQ